MDWTYLLFLIPITIMGLVLRWALKSRKNYKAPETAAEVRQSQHKFYLQQQKIEIGIGIFSIFMVIFFGLDFLGPQTSGQGKILAPFNVTTYQVRLNGSLPVNIDQQAVLLQKWNDRNNTSIITSPVLVKKMIANGGQQLSVDFKQTFLLGNITEVKLNGQLISVTAGNLTTVGLIVFLLVAIFTLGGNRQMLAAILKRRNY